MDRWWEASPVLTPNLCSASLKTMLNPVWVFGMSGPAQAQVCGIINVGMYSLVFTWQHVLDRFPGDTARSHQCSVLAFLTSHDSLGLFFLSFFFFSNVPKFAFINYLARLRNWRIFILLNFKDLNLVTYYPPKALPSFFFFFYIIWHEKWVKKFLKK